MTNKYTTTDLDQIKPGDKIFGVNQITRQTENLEVVSSTPVWDYYSIVVKYQTGETITLKYHVFSSTTGMRNSLLVLQE